MGCCWHDGIERSEDVRRIGSMSEIRVACMALAMACAQRNANRLHLSMVKWAERMDCMVPEEVSLDALVRLALATA
jgi:hypothetical protein